MVMPSNQVVKLSEDIVKSLLTPESGNRVHYFADAVIQGAKVPRGFGVRVTAAGVRSFVMNYRIGAVERRYTIGQYPDWSVLRAVKEARDLRQRIDRGEDPLDGRRKQESATETTLKAICEEYIKREGKRLRTVEWREKVFNRLVYPELGNKQIGDIKRSDIVRLLDKIEEENGPVMANRTLAIIRKVMNWHVSRSDDYVSPIARGMARKEEARERILTNDELRAVWRAAEASTGPFARMVQFILLTSGRRTEAAAMAWAELNGEWTLPASRNKTKVDLVRPLSAEARAVLPAKVDGCDYVFTTDGANPISGFAKFKLAFDKACGVTGWTLHDLRRTARSLMSRAGVPVDHAERCLGHIMPGVRDVYNPYEYLEEKRDAFNRLAALIMGIIYPTMHRPNENVLELIAAEMAKLEAEAIAR
jgi:integrase